MEVFFDTLTADTLKNIIYRSYPLDSYPISYLDNPMVVYDQEFILKDYLKKENFINNSSITGKKLMHQSGLVIIDYISTSYIESIKADIPTIFFWNKQTYFLDDSYSEFYNSLVEAGICQTDPIQAAQFVQKIKNNPEEWWRSEKVQAAKNRFLVENFGKPSVMMDYLNDLVSTRKLT